MNLQDLQAAGHRLGAAQLTASPADDRWWSAAGRSRLVPGLEAPDELSDALVTLASPPEALLLLGADDRVRLRDGRNGYGMPAVDVAPALRLSSCTATPPDQHALDVTSSWQAQLLGQLVRDGRLPEVDELRAPVTAGIRRLAGADEAAPVILTSSGTDAELVALALVLYGTGRPVVSLLVGSREAGRGTPLAAGGRWFDSAVPFGSAVQRGTFLGGLGEDLVRVVDVDVRDARGRARRAFDVEAEVEAHVEHAIGSGATVLVHALEASKTGLRALHPGWVRTWRDRHPEHLRVLVDAAQARVSRATLQAYLEAGASVLVTGSKALCGPPFSGALVLGAPMAADADRCESLPPDLGRLVSQADLPARLRHATELPRWNLGLLARWHVALAERHQLEQVDDRRRTTAALLDALRDGLAAVPGISLLPGGGSIVCFTVDGAAGSPLDCVGLQSVHRLLADQGCYVGQPLDIVEGGTSVLRVAIGASTLTRLGPETPAALGRRLGAALREAVAAAHASTHGAG
jgi:hypothetical protein